ncbi:MAG: hypothetical protein DDT36_01637 [Firmicutes bacterium]|nr:hypothetical protein [Bacillota bacterium]
MLYTISEQVLTEDLGEGVNKRLRVSDAPHLHQVDQRLHRFSLTEVVVEGLAVYQVILLEPELEEVLRHVGSTRVAVVTPPIHLSPETVYQEHLGGAAPLDYFVLLGSLLEEVCIWLQMSQPVGYLR